jgi:hypothetical protein
MTGWRTGFSLRATATTPTWTRWAFANEIDFAQLVKIYSTPRV